MKKYDRVYLVDWLPPDFGATGQYALKFAIIDGEAGLNVMLVGLTSSDSTVEYDDSGNLEIRRIKSFLPRKESNLSRLVWAIISNFSLVLLNLTVIARSREVIITGSPPFLLFFVVPFKKLFGFELRYRLTDFYPEVIFAGSNNTGLIARFSIYVTNVFRRAADVIEVLGEDQSKRLQAYGFNTSELVLRRDDSPVEFNEQADVTSNKVLNHERPVILYSGNWGVAHDTDTFVDGCYKASLNNADFDIRIQSASPIAHKVHTMLGEKGVKSLILGNLPLSELARSLASADLHLITLKSEFWGYVMPSKVYACIESGRPILYIGPKDSDVYLLCSNSRILGQDFFHFNCGDSQGVARFLALRYGSKKGLQT